MYIILYLYLFLPEIFLDVYIINVFDSDYLCKYWECHMCLMCFLGVFSCVLTVGISPTKSMSTKNTQLGKTDLQLQMRFKGQVRMFFIDVFFCTIDICFTYIYINLFDSDFTCASTLGIGYATCV